MGGAHQRATAGPLKEVDSPVSAFEPYSTPKRVKVRNHLRRWWWLYLIVLVALILLIILPIVFVGYPNIAQQKVNDASVSIDAVRVDKLTPFNFRLSVDATLNNPSSDEPLIGPFNASMYLPDSDNKDAFAYVEFPQIKSVGATVVNISQVVNVTNENYASLLNFNRVLVQNKTFNLATSAKQVPLQLSGLPTTHVDFDKTVSLKGMNNLTGTVATNLSFSLLPDTNGNNIHLNLSVPNPSVYTLDLGNVSFTNYVNGSKVGTAHVADFLTSPGITEFALDGRANLDLLSKVVQKPYCDTGILPMKVRISNVDVGGTSIAYIVEALNQLQIDQDVAFKDAIKNALGIEVTCGLDILAGLGLASQTSSTISASTASVTSDATATSATAPTITTSADSAATTPDLLPVLSALGGALKSNVAGVQSAINSALTAA